MKKAILGISAVIVLGIVIYYGRYLVFDKKVNEEAPQIQTDMQQQNGEVGSNFESSFLTGEFNEVDRVHKGSGTATLIRQGDERVLRFENFRVTNGPDLYVYLTTNSNPTGDKASLGYFINLGRLKGNVGNQNYIINAADLSKDDLDAYSTVVIWCEQFGVLFSYANLK